MTHLSSIYTGYWTHLRDDSLLRNEFWCKTTCWHNCQSGWFTAYTDVTDCKKQNICMTHLSSKNTGCHRSLYPLQKANCQKEGKDFWNTLSNQCTNPFFPVFDRLFFLKNPFKKSVGLGLFWVCCRGLEERNGIKPLKWPTITTYMTLSFSPSFYLSFSIISIISLSLLKYS